MHFTEQWQEVPDTPEPATTASDPVGTLHPPCGGRRPLRWTLPEGAAGVCSWSRLRWRASRTAGWMCQRFKFDSYMRPVNGRIRPAIRCIENLCPTPFCCPPPRSTLAPATCAATPPPAAPGIAFNRIAYSAAHVVAEPTSSVDPWLTAAIDWDTTIAYRRHLVAGPGCGRSHGHRPARHGPGLADLAGADRRSLDAAKDFTAQGGTAPSWPAAAAPTTSTSTP